jgi:hypothetical protein
MNKQQTAVEWFIEQLEEHLLSQDIVLQLKNTEAFEQAKEMERNQIINTWYNGYINQSPMVDEENCGEQFYKETFGGAGETRSLKRKIS